MDSREDSLPVACSQPSPSPYCSFHLPDDASGTFERGPLWGVHLLHLLELEDIAHIRSLAAAHVNEHGWSTSRHRHHPTTDFAVDEAPALDLWLRPLVQTVILPVMARLYAFEEEGERLSIRDLFYVRYDAAAQDRLSAHRDGTLLSFSVLLSEPGRDFEGGGTRFSSLGGACEACGCGSAASGGGRAGSDNAVRVGVDTWVVGQPGALVVDRETLTAPYTVLAIGDPPTLAAAMNIPGGATDSIERVGGTMVIEQSDRVDVTALRQPKPRQYAQPVK